MQVSYPRETRIKAYELLDQGVPAKEVAKRLKVQLNTIYAWSRTDKRAEFHRALGILNPSIAPRPRGRPPKALAQGYAGSRLAAVPSPPKAEAAGVVREVVSAPVTDLEFEVERLRTENEYLKKVVEMYEKRGRG